MDEKQLYQAYYTPDDLARRMVSMAGIEPRHTVLEPSAGEGSILRHLPAECVKTAVELDERKCEKLRELEIPGLTVHNTDFLSFQPTIGKFDRILMNPPFTKGQDIKHIIHAQTMLKPKGELLAICGRGPRQEKALKPLASFWEVLPAGTFKESGTGVNTVLLTIEN